jgi:hypothetical protein
MCRLPSYLLVHVPQVGLELAVSGVEALLFSQCNMVWRSPVMAGSLGFPSFAYSGLFFFCQVWLQQLSQLPDLWSSPCQLLPSSHHLETPQFHSSLWLNNTPLCLYTYLCMCIKSLHIFFTHSSVHGHLGLFHILTIVNSE